jgi:acyl transferase domain-containing protein
VSVDTACSSSLVAAHAAASALALGQCGGALVGGANLCLSPDTPAAFAKAGMLAPDGRCKTLDAAADGYVRAEAVGVLLLQLLAPDVAATAAAAPLALLAGSAVNQDGRSSGLTAPNGPAQQDVLRAALAAAGLGPGEVCGLQLHGTGTGLGDPIEVGAAAAVFGAAGGDGPTRSPFVLMAAKTNLGHSEPAAGVVGLLQATFSLSQRAALPLLHLRTLNPLLVPLLRPEGGGARRGCLLPRGACGQPMPRCSGAFGGAPVVGTSAFAYQVCPQRLWGAELCSIWRCATVSLPVQLLRKCQILISFTRSCHS